MSKPCMVRTRKDLQKYIHKKSRVLCKHLRKLFNSPIIYSYNIKYICTLFNDLVIENDRLKDNELIYSYMKEIIDAYILNSWQLESRDIGYWGRLKSFSVEYFRWLSCELAKGDAIDEDVIRFTVLKMRSKYLY